MTVDGDAAGAPRRPAAARKRVSPIRPHFRTIGLLAATPAEADVTLGYLDLLGDDPPPSGVAQRLMRNRLVAGVYEDYWRPWLGRIAKGFAGPSMADEVRLAIELLRLRAGQTVLDVACGTGKFTRAFGAVVGAGGLAIGLDGSRPMLARAVANTGANPAVEYVRADAVTLPFAPSTVEGLCCFAALHMFGDPEAALDSFAATLKPGGRIALLTSGRRDRLPARFVDTVVGRLSDQRMFDRGEVRSLLARRGFTDITETYAGVAQLVAATRQQS